MGELATDEAVGWSELRKETYTLLRGRRGQCAPVARSPTISSGRAHGENTENRTSYKTMVISQIIYALPVTLFTKYMVKGGKDLDNSKNYQNGDTSA